MVKHTLKQTIFLFGELVAFIAMLILFLGIFTGLILPLIEDDFVETLDQSLLFESNPLQLTLIQFIPSLVFTLIALWIFQRFIVKRPLALLGLNKNGILPQFGIGWLIGTGLILIGFLMMTLLGVLSFHGTNWNTGLIFGFLLMFLIQSFSEEVLFRSYLIPTIEYRLGLPAALILSSLAFMVIHFFNPNINPLGMLDLFVGGILMGLLFIKYRNVWAPTGMHAAWNYIQSTILGYEVSGIKTYSWLNMIEVGPDIITGGAFGYEGSVFSTLFQLIFIYFFVKSNPDLISIKKENHA